MNFGKRFSLFLLPSTVQAVISFGMVPVITYVLGPEEYGVFALVSIVPSLITAVGAMGAGYLFAEHYPLISINERRQMISTILFIGIAILLVFTVSFFPLWVLIVQDWDAFAKVPLEGVMLSLVAMILAFPWVIANDIIVLDAKARLYAAVNIIQSIAAAITVTIGLYIFKWGVLSLFVASAVTAFILFVGAVVVLKPYIRFTLTRIWAKEIFAIGLPATAANIMETLHTFFERYTLSLYVGLGHLGLYSHSQQYKNLAAMSVKAVTLTMWPITLSESRNYQHDFIRTKEVWDVAYVGITVVGLLFATLGKDIVALLTHNKFTEAYVLIALWMVFLLVWSSGKAQTSILYTSGQTRFYSKMMMVAASVGVLLMFVLVPLYGLWGMMLAVFAQQILFRVGIQLRVKKDHDCPFQDRWVLIGSGAILIALVLEKYFQFGMSGNIMLFVGICILFGVLSRRVIAYALVKTLDWLGVRADGFKIAIVKDQKKGVSQDQLVK